jgi:prevent-host-death family protein
MTITTAVASDRSPHRNPYDLDMAKRELVGIQDLRLKIKTVFDKVGAGIHVIPTRHGKPVAALVPIEWYRRAAEKMGEPTDL